MTTSPDWRPHRVAPEQHGVEASVRGLASVLSETERIDALLAEHNALEFRGFGVAPTELEEVFGAVLPNRLAYVYGNSPRTKVGSNVYTSTEYPQEHTISMHGEMSYAPQWPARLLFYCETAAESGGATPVVDAASWLRALDDDVVAAFEGGVRYTQNLHGGRGLGKSWQDTFETEDREQVDGFLAGSGAEWEWRSRNALRIVHTRPAIVEDPRSGERIWFNQSDQWHPAALDDPAAARLMQALPPEDLPQSVAFADGSPIPGEHVVQVRDRGLDTAVDVDWADGDLLLIDNVRVAHGRRPFTGSRRVLVAMSD